MRSIERGETLCLPPQTTHSLVASASTGRCVAWNDRSGFNKTSCGPAEGQGRGLNFTNPRHEEGGMRRLLLFALLGPIIGYVAFVVGEIAINGFGPTGGMHLDFLSVSLRSAARSVWSGIDWFLLTCLQANRASSWRS